MYPVVKLNGRARWLGLCLFCLVGCQTLRAEPAATGTSTAPSPAAPSPANAEWPAPLPLSGATQLGPIRGVTVGPIENGMHPGRGYGSPACARAMADLRAMGATWVSLTPFGRVWDLQPAGIDLRFETPYRENRANVKAAVRQAHAVGLKVLLVPHLWVESGQWRAEIDPKTPEQWQIWADAYEAFLLEWASAAAESGVDLLAIGVEMRSWLTTTHAPSFLPVLKKLRQRYHGPLTYAANWDDVVDTVILGQLDVIGINAFYPLTDHEGASFEEMRQSAIKLADQVEELSLAWNKPVIFTEFGYTARKDPALKPWEWPEHLQNVVKSEAGQALAYRALVSAFIERPWFHGFFVWRVYADPDDVSQETVWGFSPRGKLAELTLRDAFSTHWAVDGLRLPGRSLWQPSAARIGNY